MNLSSIVNPGSREERTQVRAIAEGSDGEKQKKTNSENTISSQVEPEAAA